MAITEHYHTKFEPGRFYHIYNRTIDKKPLFKNDGNYLFFLIKYDLYLSSVLDTYAYNLLGNHFHLLVRIKEDLAIVPDMVLPEEQFITSSAKDLTNFQNLSNLKPEKTTHDIVSHQFRKFFQSYAMAFNKQQERSGNLFQTPFKRAWVDNDSYLAQVVYYIHANAQIHGLVDDFRSWKWSSYNSILSEKQTKLKKQVLIEWFENVEGYKKYHLPTKKIKLDRKYLLEDE